MTRVLRPAFAGLLFCSVLAACTGDDPVAPLPETAGPVELAQLDCRVTVASGDLRCASASPSTGDAGGLVMGGQGVYVFLAAAGHSYDAGAGIYSINVTVQNLILQALGTTDGTTLDGEGVRIFFLEEPAATDGTGLPVSVANPTGMAPFVSGVQPYFQYSEVLSPNETSGALPWQFSVPSGVASFGFRVYVATPVQYPTGWVDLTPAADTMVTGGTQALTATVRNVVGTVIPGQTVTFGSSDEAVGTVDGAGLVTGVAPGSATITATAGARSGQATLAVCPDLAVGGVYTATMPAASSICFAGGASGTAEYTYMPVNLSSSSSLSLGVTGSGITAVTGPPSPSLAPGGLPLLNVSAQRVAASDDLHMARMQRDYRDVAGLLHRPGARVSRRPAAARRAPRGPSYVITPGTPTVGDLWNLNVASGCSGTPDLRAGRVVSIKNHVIVVADTSNPAGGFTTAQYDSIALEFDSIAYPVDTANFGAPTDLDENGRVVAFYTRAVNELSPPASSVIVNGYFTARDLFGANPESCTLSNEGEIFYMLVPDPTGAVNSNVRTVSSVRSGTVGTMGHELQHLINASRRIYVNDAVSYEEVWLNEGLSHVAEELMFFRMAPGLAPRGNIILSALNTGPNASRRVAAFNTYLNPNFQRLRPWLQRPDTAGAFKTNDGLATRGAVWGFLRYAADRRNGSDAAFWSSLVNSRVSGVANLQEVLGVQPTLWLRDFTAAMYADDAVAGIGPELQTTTFSYRSIYGGLGGFPLLARPLSNGVALNLSYSRGGGTAYTRFGVPAGGFAGVRALSAGLPPTSPYSLIVVRTR